MADWFSPLTAVRLLLAWTLLGGLWHLATLALLTWGVHFRKRRLSFSGQPPCSQEILLTLFKPLPPPGTEAEKAAVREALASFGRQLAPHHECLVGIRSAMAESWSEVRRELESAFPSGSLRFVIAEDLPGHANPKVAWLERLSRDARGSWWLWSDADITAPQGFLGECDALCTETGPDFATFPYLVRGIHRAAGAWDLAFNLSEFMPGVFLLGARGRIRFALGAGVLLRAAAFREKLSWKELGRQLADDHLVGQKLGPGTLGASILSTTACEDSMKAGVLHYLRWLKTVRWCQPAGFAFHLAACPVLGWWLAALLAGDLPAWIGLALWAGWETAVLILACELTQSRPFLRAVPCFFLICLARPWLRLFCWLPWPVVWRGQYWHGPESFSLPSADP